jgi:hypothetical protein
MKFRKKRSIYLQMQAFASLTKEFMIQGNMERVKKCIQVVEELYTNGNHEVKNAISNVYLYSVTAFLEMHRYNIKKMLPVTLQQEYYKQINTADL